MHIFQLPASKNKKMCHLASFKKKKIESYGNLRNILYKYVYTRTAPIQIVDNIKSHWRETESTDTRSAKKETRSGEEQSVLALRRCATFKGAAPLQEIEAYFVPSTGWCALYQ